MTKKSTRNQSEKEKTGFWWLSRKTNPAKLFFFLLVLFIPAQLGRHFWPDFSFIFGLRVDYLSPTLYLTDILILLIFISWFLANFSFIKKNLKKLLSTRKKIFIFILIILAGLISAKNKGAGFFGLIKFIEFLLLGLYIAREIKKEDLGKIVLCLSAGVFVEGIIAILQYFNQGSLGGFFYFLGERSFNGNTPGIANASVSGKLVLRPYGTFPHPNVLAGYFTIAMTMIVSIFSSKRTSFFEAANFKFSIFKKTFLAVSLLIGSLALFLTLSRVAVLVWLIFLGFYMFFKITAKKIESKKLLIIFPTLLFVFLIFSFVPIPQRYESLSFSDLAVTQREELLAASSSMLKAHPLFGVGVNNFLVNLPGFEKETARPFFLQPVHNIFLLVLTETGIIGFLIFLWFLIKTILKDNSFVIRVLLLEIVALGFFDHYFLTLQQGQLLFVLVLGLSWSKLNYKVK